MSELTFEPPGPGRWRLDHVHKPEPVSYYLRDVSPPAHVEGGNEAAEKYGSLYNVEIALVNGFLYWRRRPVVAPPTTGGEAYGSPGQAEDGVTFRQRLERLAETYETKRWREDLERWDEDWKPTHQETNRRLQAVDPAALSDEDLIDHLEDCRDACRRGIFLHHRMGLASIPQSDFLAHASTWTSRSPGELVSLFDGASPDSAGALDELDTVARAIEASSDAQRILESETPPGEVLDELRKTSDDIATAMDAWLAVVGFRPISGWDLTTPYALEQPATLVRSLRQAVESEVDEVPEHDTTERVDQIRSEVPSEHRDTFDEMFEEAWRVSRIRDERDFVDMPSRGVLRRAILEAGRRLVNRAQLDESAHAVDMTHDELVAALREHPAPSPDTVAERVAYRESHGRRDAPDRLGSEPSDPFAAYDLTEAARRKMRGTAAFQEAIASDHPHASEGTMLRGAGASSGTVDGPARVISGPAELADVKEGEILVVETTSPGYNVVLPLISGIVTELGGKLSHAAIVARESGIPAVLGCEWATERIQTGDRIAVDGDEGTVQFL